MAIESLEAMNGCTGCEKIRVEQEEIDKPEKEEESSSDENLFHDLGVLTVSQFIYPIQHKH